MGECELRRTLHKKGTPENNLLNEVMIHNQRRIKSDKTNIFFKHYPDDSKIGMFKEENSEKKES